MGAMLLDSPHRQNRDQAAAIKGGKIARGVMRPKAVFHL
jgi:hypothetical protein